VERALLELLTLHRPDDAVLSEEAGALGAGRRRWLLDPIDGTEGFRAGGPVWDNHIALEVDGQLTVGIDTRPTQGRALVGVHGQGAYRSVHMRQAAIRAIRAATASVPVPIRTTTPKSSRSSHITHRPPAATQHRETRGEHGPRPRPEVQVTQHQSPPHAPTQTSPGETIRAIDVSALTVNVVASRWGVTPSWLRATRRGGAARAAGRSRPR
jgi:hypothetical protein